MHSVTSQQLTTGMMKRTAATITGVSFLLMFVLGIFAEFFVRNRLIHWDDPAATYSGIQNNMPLFGAGILGFVGILLLDVIIAIAFYVLFAEISLFTGMVMTCLRIVYVAMKGASLAGLLLARDIADDNVVDAAAISQMMSWLKMHHIGFSVALLFFGFHLIFLSKLTFGRRMVPKVINLLLLLAGIGYIFNSIATLFLGDFPLVVNTVIAVFIIPMTFGEIALGLWLWRRRKLFAN